MSEAKTGKNHPMFGIIGENHPSYGKIHSTETKVKISLALTDEKHPMYGKTHSAETKALMSQAHKGKYHSAESRAKISATQGTTILVYSKDHTLVNNFSSAREAARYFICSHPTITNYAVTGKLFQGQWLLFLSSK